MRFSLSHERMVIGHRITVKVTASSGETIDRVLTKLDGRKLADDTVHRLDDAGGLGLVAATNLGHDDGRMRADAGVHQRHGGGQYS